MINILQSSLLAGFSPRPLGLQYTFSSANILDVLRKLCTTWEVGLGFFAKEYGHFLLTMFFSFWFMAPV